MKSKAIRRTFLSLIIGYTLVDPLTAGPGPEKTAANIKALCKKYKITTLYAPNRLQTEKYVERIVKIKDSLPEKLRGGIRVNCDPSGNYWAVNRWVVGKPNDCKIIYDLKDGKIIYRNDGPGILEIPTYGNYAVLEDVSEVSEEGGPTYLTIFSLPDMKVVLPRDKNFVDGFYQDRLPKDHVFGYFDKGHGSDMNEGLLNLKTGKFTVMPIEEVTKKFPTKN